MRNKKKMEIQRGKKKTATGIKKPGKSKNIKRSGQETILKY